MKILYLLIYLPLCLFVFTGCKSTVITSRYVEHEEKSLSHTMVYDGFELDKLYLNVGEYDAQKEPRVSIHTEFIEYERRSDKMETWKVEVKEGLAYKSVWANHLLINGPEFWSYIAPVGFLVEAAADVVQYPLFSLGLIRYYGWDYTETGSKYGIDNYTKTGERERKYSRSGAKLPETVSFRLVDLKLTVRMSYVDGQYKIVGEDKKRLLDLDVLTVKFPFEDEARTLSLTAFHRAHQDHLNLKHKRAQKDAYAAKQQQLALEEEARKNRAINQHKSALVSQSERVLLAVNEGNWKGAVSLQKELLSLMEGSADNRPSKTDLSSAYEKLIEYASESGDFDEITRAMELHKKVKGE